MSLSSRLGLVCAVSAAAVGLVLAMCSPALADRAFTARFSANANGDIKIVGNTLETCQSAAANCLRARWLAGANFAATRASALVIVPPRVIACPSSVWASPQGQIAC
jgi:hypothetical protein